MIVKIPGDSGGIKTQVISLQICPLKIYYGSRLK